MCFQWRQQKVDTGAGALSLRARLDHKPQKQSPSHTSQKKKDLFLHLCCFKNTKENTRKNTRTDLTGTKLFREKKIMDSMHVVQRNKTRVTGDPMLDGAYDPDDDDNVFSASTFPWTLVDMADDNNRASCNNGTNMSPSFCAPNANNVDTDTDNSGTSGSTVSTTGTNGIFDSQNQTATKTGKDKESNSPSTSSFRYDRWTYRGPLVSKQKLSEKVKETLEDTDRLIAKELSEMSIKERDLVLSDLHGLKREDDNTTRELQNSTLVRDALKQLDYEISKLKKHRQAYDKALFLNPSYVMNQTFRLKFLRADRFNTVKAARRLIQHFDFKLELFGIEKLARDITFDDLNDDEQEIYLAGGFWPVHNAYDRTGRRIVLAMLDRFIFKHPNNNVRTQSVFVMPFKNNTCTC